MITSSRCSCVFLFEGTRTRRPLDTINVAAAFSMGNYEWGVSDLHTGEVEEEEEEYNYSLEASPLEEMTMSRR